MQDSRQQPACGTDNLVDPPRGRLDPIAGACAIGAILLMTVRFPPSDLVGWIASGLRVPTWTVFLGGAVLAGVGRAMSTRRAWKIINTTVLLIAVYSAVVTAIHNS